MFAPKNVFQTLYRDIFHQVNKSRVIAFEESPEIILRSGFINKVETQLGDFFEQSIRGKRTPPLEIHKGNLRSFKDLWYNIQSSSTCLACLRRRPQHGLQCGHIACEDCVQNFGERSLDDPRDFKVYYCFLCGVKMTPEITVKTHPPTAGVGVLCIDGGGARAVLPLKIMKRIENRIGLPIPLQRFFKVAFGISSGESPWLALGSPILTVSRWLDHHGHVPQRLVH